MDTIPADKLVKAYIKLRDARAVLKSEYEAQDAVLLEKVATIESKLLEFCRVRCGRDQNPLRDCIPYC